MASENDNQSGTKTTGVTIVFLIFVLIVVGFSISSFFFDEADVDTPETDVGEAPVSTVGQRAVTDFDQRAALTVIQARQEDIERKARDSERAQIELKDELQAMLKRNEELMQQQMSALVKELERSNRAQIEGAYGQVIAEKPTEETDINFDLDELGDGDLGSPIFNDPNPIADIRSKRKREFGEHYIFLSDDEQNEADPNAESGIQSATNDILNRPRQSISGNNSNSRNGNRSQQNQQQTIARNAEPEPTTEKVTIGATSFANVTTLFAVNCPMGGELANQPSGIAARPIILPLTGSFTGANGRVIDLGNANVYGTCAGRRTENENIGRAEIRIANITYWDEESGVQTENVSGFIIDLRDGEMDVAGYISELSKTNLLKESAALSAAAFAATVSANEFTATTGADSGNELRTLTGDAASAGAGNAVAAGFTRYAARLEQIDAQNVDTVRIPAGIPLRFFTDSAVTVEKAKQTDGFDTTDVLI